MLFYWSVPFIAFDKFRDPILNVFAHIFTFHKHSCSSAISTLEGIENKQRLQTLSIDNAWSNKNFCITWRFVCYNIHLQKWTVITVTNILKNTKIKRGTGDKIKNNDKIDTTGSWYSRIKKKALLSYTLCLTLLLYHGMYSKTCFCLQRRKATSFLMVIIMIKSMV